MRTVWKYNLTPDTVLDLCLVTPKIVFVDCEPQNSLPSIWVEHGGITDLARMCVTFIGTGHEVPQPRPGWDYWRHIGSCRSQNGFFVWHAYHAVPAVPGWGVMKAVQTPIGLVVCAHPTVLRYDTCEEGRPGATNYEILGSDQSTWINPGDTLTVDVPCKTCSTCHRERRSWDSPCTCGYAYGGPPPLVIGTVSRTVRVVKVLPICKSFPIGGEHDYRHHPNATAVLVVFDQATELWTWNDRAIELPRRRTVDLPDASPGGVALIVEVVEQT